MNILLFRVFGINYIKVLKYDLIKLEEDSMSATVSPTGAAGSVADSSTNASGAVKTSLLLKTSHSSDMLASDDELGLDEAVIAEDYPSERKVTWMRLVAFSLGLLLLLHFTYWYWIEVRGGGSIGAVLAFYSGVAVVLLLPLPATAWLRKATHITFYRLFELVHPRCCFQNAQSLPRLVPFVDVFLADALCSLSKVFFDWGMLLHMLSHYPDPVPADAHNIILPSAFAAVPYLIRARQCIVMYFVAAASPDPKKRFDHVYNAIKYSTSIFPLLLSAYQKTVSAKQAEALEMWLILLLVINASYSLWWDIVKDWGMMQSPAAAIACRPSKTIGGTSSAKYHLSSCTQAFLRSHLRFGVGVSFLILIADCVLRFSWLLRFYHKLFPSGDSFVLCSQFLEVFRRALWNLLRVEWENLKQSRTLTSVVKEDEELVLLKGNPTTSNRKRVTA